MPRKTDPAKFDHAISLYGAGATLREAASEAGVSFSPLRREMIARGIPRRPANRIETPDAEIVAAYKSGESELSISKRLGLERVVVRRRLLEQGVAIRGGSEAQALRASRMTAEERQRNTRAAHKAARRTHTEEERRKMARTRERNESGVTRTERYFAQLLEERGLPTTLQKAVGRYNIDIAAGPVAVEVFGGGWHGTGRHLARAPKRFRYLLDEGWPFVIVWTDGRHAPLLPEAADYIAAFAELVSSDPSASREYRVIWGTGEEATPLKPELDKIALVPSLAGRDRSGSAD